MEDLQFKVKARLLNQLGEQLIKNESVALLELVKNSYDADARTCDVIMEIPDDSNKGMITIADDGSGMSYNTLTKVWLEIGTSYKEDQKKDKTFRSEKFGRRPLGEKGIGRFGVHRLGHKIELISSSDGETEVHLNIDWDKIDNSDYLQEVPFTIEEKNASLFADKTGTKIIIRDLKGNWTKNKVKDCARTISSLNSPFTKQDNFSVNFKLIKYDWLNEIIDHKSIEQFKLFSFDISIKKNKITDFFYNFTPWPVMTKIEKRTLTINDLKGLTELKDIDHNKIDISVHNIGPIRFTGIIFHLESWTLSLGGITDKKGLKEYLKDNGGIRVYRDNMRIMDYGEPGNDWLELDSRRVNIPTKRFSNNIIIGAVYLDSGSSEKLVEKANREGFIENEAYETLKKALILAISKIEQNRHTDKEKLQTIYGPKKHDEPVISTLWEVKDLVNKKIKEENTKKALLKYVDRISEDYSRITDSLIKSAGAGINLIIVIHQMQKLIKNIILGIKQKIPYTNLEEQIKILSNLVEGYSILIKKSESKKRDLTQLTKNALFNIELRLDDHKIELELNISKERNFNKYGICPESHFLNALINLIDNSIWWLEHAETNKPSIYIDIYNKTPGFTTLIFADNGPGFVLPKEELCIPFVSAKPDGMGIGLHLTKLIMDSIGGNLSFPEPTDYDIPKKYQQGAIIALSFRNGEDEDEFAKFGENSINR